MLSAAVPLPRTVAVDLTPLLPGGENGGARIFVLELLVQLAELAPQTRFILLTQAASHGHLASLERPNMRRYLVVGPLVGNALRPLLLGVAGRLVSHLPASPRRAISRLGYSVNALLKRGGTRGLLRDLGADLLFCPFTAPTYWEPGVATVCILYDLQYRAFPEFFAPEDLAHRDRAFAEACRRASVLVAISDHTRLTALEQGELDPKRIRTIHPRMARRLSCAGGRETSILDQLGLEPGHYLVYPANFWPHKNHEGLLSAFDLACRSGLPERIQLICSGAPGPRTSSLRELARRLGLEARVRFPGYLSDPDLAALMIHAVGLIFPSRYEGFGLPVIEAMAAGIPVACSRVTALPEITAEAAILFDPQAPDQMARAMVELVRDEARRARLIRAGHVRARQFSDVRRMAADYWAVFQDATKMDHASNRRRPSKASPRSAVSQSSD